MTARNFDSVISLYLLANNASTRLTTECYRPDQRLVRMVAHANMLDRLNAEISTREHVVQLRQTDSHRQAQQQQRQYSAKTISA